MVWSELLSYAAGTFLTLFPIANPLLALPVFYRLTAAHDQAYRRREALRTAVYVAVVLTVTLLAGEFILDAFGISLAVVKIAGGLIVAHTAWEMVTVRERLTTAEGAEAATKEDIAFSPMAMPLISGPGAMGVVLSLAAKTSAGVHTVGCLIAIGLIGVVTYVCLAIGERLATALGTTGMGALSRVMGFLLLAIAVQLLAEGVLALMPGAASGR